MIAAPKRMTVEEFLALPPDDDVERMLIDGELREYPAMAYRNRYHSCSMTLAATRLQVWLESQPEPRGQVLTGDVGFRIPTEPSTLFGLDIAYVPAAVLAASPANSTVIHGLPALAIEIVSPSDTHERIKEKLGKLLSAGTPLVWIMDTYDHTVTAYRPGAEPRLYTASQTIDAEPLLPGFRASVAGLFG